MRIAIFGAGGVGGYFGGRLAQAGEELVFIARGEHLRALQSQGLRVDSIKGDFTVKPVQATDNPRAVGEVDAVLVAVKGWQVSDAALDMQSMIGPNTCVVSLGNGVDAPAQLAAVLGADHILGGLCQISAFKAGPGHIRHVGIEPFVAFGELDNRSTQRVEALRQAFEGSGVAVRVPPNIRIAMWEKFVFIVSISGVGAVARVPAGALRSLPETRQLMEQAIQEAVNVGRAGKVGLPEDSLQKTMAMIDRLEPGVIPSMQRDIIEGRPSELGSQNGAIVRMGLEMGIPTPTHTFIYNSLLPQELLARNREGRGNHTLGDQAYRTIEHP